jgi:hypothetical protein
VHANTDSSFHEACTITTPSVFEKMKIQYGKEMTVDSVLFQTNIDFLTSNGTRDDEGRDGY